MHTDAEISRVLSELGFRVDRLCLDVGGLRVMVVAYCGTRESTMAMTMALDRLGVVYSYCWLGRYREYIFVVKGLPQAVVDALPTNVYAQAA